MEQDEKGIFGQHDGTTVKRALAAANKTNRELGIAMNLTRKYVTEKLNLASWKTDELVMAEQCLGVSLFWGYITEEVQIGNQKVLTLKPSIREGLAHFNLAVRVDDIKTIPGLLFEGKSTR